MKSKNAIKLVSLKLNKDIAKVLHKGKKITLKNSNIWLAKSINETTFKYALLVNKSYFKLAVTRNKIKRILRSLLQEIVTTGGLIFLIRPTSNFINFSYNQNKHFFIEVFKRYANF